MDQSNLSRRGFLASAGTVLASLTFSLASGPAAAFAEDADGVEPLSAEGEAGEAVDDSRIMIVHTNDVHCAFNNKTTQLGYAKLADYVTEQRKKYGQGRVSLVDAGDNIQGDVNGSLSQGDYPARVIKACKYAVMTCGNHEFDYGMQTFFSVRQTEETPYVCCNFLQASGERYFDAYKVIEYTVAGQTVKVAYVGAVTPSTITSSTPASFKDKDGNVIYSFCGDKSGEKLYAAIQSAVDEARSTGDADYVVLLAHLGQAGAPTQWRSDAVVAKTRGIDLVLDGHSHEEYVQTAKNLDGQDVVITQTGTKFSSFSSTVIDPASGAATVRLTATGVASELVKEWDGSDEEIAALVAQLDAELAKKTEVIIGKTTVDLRVHIDNSSQWASRAHETNMGDLVADAFFYRAANLGRKCDLALVGSGGIRADIDAGDITYGDCVSALAFNNQVACLRVTGQHILNMLEIGVRKYPNPSGGFLQVSEGVSFTLRTDLPTPVVMVDDESAVEKYVGERRVQNATLFGEPIDPEKEYDLIATNYMLVAGGDAMPIPDNVDDVEFLGLETDALIDYVQVNLHGVIGEGYENPAGAGRIKMSDHAEEVVPEDGSGSGDGSGSDADADGDAQNATPKSGTGNVPTTGDTAVDLAGVAALGAAAVAGAVLLAE